MATMPTASDPTAAAASATADTYTNFSGLQALKRAAAKNDPTAIRKVAQQFESMFTRMMLKSMRDTVGTDPLFGSDAEKTYQGMYDDQLAIQMSKGRGLGLADMLVRQLQRLGAAGAAAVRSAAAASRVAVRPAPSVALAQRTLPPSPHCPPPPPRLNRISSRGSGPRPSRPASSSGLTRQPDRAGSAGDQLGSQSAP